MIHPGWVLPAGSSDQHLSVTSARAFTRIVQTLCEPPASTVRSHHRGNKEELESAIRKEKKLVAKAVGPLLEVYILRVQKESMDPDVRKEVLIAMGHVAEVLGSKRIGKISDRMTVEARAVLRSLWKDLGLRGRERV